MLVFWKVLLKLSGPLQLHAVAPLAVPVKLTVAPVQAESGEAFAVSAVGAVLTVIFTESVTLPQVLPAVT